MAIGTALGLASGLVGAGASFLGAKEQADAQRDALAQMRVELPGSSVFGISGLTSRIGPTGNIDIDVGGRLGTAASRLRNLAATSALRAGRQGLPGNVQSADLLAQLTASRIPGLDVGGLRGFEAAAGGLAGGSLAQAGNLLGGGFQRGLQGSAFDVAGGALAGLPQTEAAAAGRALTGLRAQALPQQQRAVDSTLTNLFSTGRLGTTGGANVIGRLAEAQNQQDLGFQLAAGQEGRAALASQFGLAQGATGLGSGLRGLEDELLQSAFGRFGQTAGLAAGLNRDIFGRTLGINELAAGRAQQNLMNQIGLAGLPGQLQGTQLGLALQALQGQAGIEQQGINLAQLGLNRDVATANARIGSGTNMGNLVSSPNFQASPLSTLGNLGTSAFTAFAGTQPGQNALNSLFSSFGGGGGGGAGITPLASEAIAAGVS